MKKTLQLDRTTTRRFNEYSIQALTKMGFTFSPSEFCWVTIMEPENNHINNSILDDGNKLEMSFWDITAPRTVEFLTDNDGKIIGKDVTIQPPSREDAKQIVDFLIKHKDQDVITNCAAGISRSSAICQFLEDFMDYEWIREFKRKAMPNNHLYRMMAEEYNKITEEKNGDE